MSCKDLLKKIKHHAKRNEPVTEGQTLEYVYLMMNLEESHSQRRKAEWWLPGSGGGSEAVLRFMGIILLYLPPGKSLSLNSVLGRII